MKIKKAELEKIVKSELLRLLQEGFFSDFKNVKKSTKDNKVKPR